MGKPGATLGYRVAPMNTARITSTVATERARGREAVESRRRILLRDQFVCQSCKRVTLPNRLQVDHIVPLHMGGHDTDENKQVLCVDCHLIKSEAEEKVRGGGIE